MTRSLLAVLVPAVLPVLPTAPMVVTPVVLAAPVSEPPLEPQPTPIAAITKRAASGHRFLFIAPSLGRGLGRRTSPGSPDRWLPGAARSARARWHRSGKSRSRRRA